MKIGSVVTVRGHREIPSELHRKRGVILAFDADLKRATVQMHLNPAIFLDSEIVELRTFKIPVFYLESAKPASIPTPVFGTQGKKVFICEEDIPLLKSIVARLVSSSHRDLGSEVVAINGIIMRYENQLE